MYLIVSSLIAFLFDFVWKWVLGFFENTIVSKENVFVLTFLGFQQVQTIANSHLHLPDPFYGVNIFEKGKERNAEGYNPLDDKK